jgi:hypothetical protein
MDEIILSLSLGLAELFFEFLLELGSEGVVDLLSRVAGDNFPRAEALHRVQMFFVYGLLGALAGAGSLMIFPHPLFHPSKIHGISLVVSPIITGVAMSALGSLLRRREVRVVSIESFPNAFTFAFGMALVRFLHVS